MIKMEVNVIKINKPRNRQAALNQAAYFFIQKEQIEIRRTNIMKNIKDTQAKLAKLEETLLGYETQIEKFSLLDQNLDAELESLLREFELLKSEILVTRSILLTTQIAKLRKEADILKTGEVEQF